ncbi:MAG TPA: DUF1302 family protein, partial [Nevskiaceae bacterium]|nr:DUF1302 family protein [Nevskiaceae bacterium]
MRKVSLMRGTVGVVCALAAANAAAFEFELGGTQIHLDNLVTAGAVMRMQDRDPTLIGKPNVTPGLCQVRTSGAPAAGAQPLPDYAHDPGQSTNAYAPGLIGAACATSETADITLFNNSPGSFSVNGDNGDLNFNKHQLVQATAKLTTDLSFNIAGFNVFARGLYFFDQRYHGKVETHPDTTMAPLHTDFSDAGKRDLGTRAQVLDYFVSRVFDVGDHQLSVKVGDQVLNWGESSFLIANSLNSLSPPNQALLRLPGFDIKELFQPVGMVYASGTITQGVSLEGFYQYQWKPVVADPVGSFFSTSDTLGDGGSLAMLSFARAPEDYGYPINDPRYPAGRRGYYRAIDTCNLANFNPSGPDLPCFDSAGTLGSTSSRSIFRDHAEEKRREPPGTGQYGMALKVFADSLNGGTEFGFYFANYHSRFPVVSAFAALDTCITNQAT